MNQFKLNALDVYVQAILSTGASPCTRSDMESLLQLAREVLRKKASWTRHFFSPSILVSVATRRSGEQQTTAKLLHPASRRKYLYAAFPHYVVLAHLCQLEGRQARELEQDVTVFRHFFEQAEQFDAAISPQQLSLQSLRTRFDRRIATWHSRSHWADSDIIAHARKIFAKELKAQDSIDELCLLIPARRLATCDDEALRQIAEHHERWSPLVHLFTGEHRGPVPAWASRRLEELRSQLMRTVAKRRTPRFAEDAVDAALSAAIRRVDDPDHRYTYEQDFYRWLVSRALAEAARLNRAASREAAWSALAGIDPPSTSQTCAGACDIAVQHVCRLLFAQYLFAEHRPRLRQLWFLRLTYEDSLEDEVLSKLIEMESGEQVTAQALGLMRFRLRQRLAVLEYVLDHPEKHGTDAGTFEGPLTHAGMLVGTGKEDGALALYRATAYAWAAQADGDRLMLLPTVTCAAFECRDIGMESAIAYGRKMLELWRSAGGVAVGSLSVDELDRRFDRLRRWYDTSADTLDELRRIARDGNVSFLVGVCIYLRVVQLRTVDEALAIVRPTTTEAREAMRSMLERLGCPSS